MCEPAFKVKHFAAVVFIIGITNIIVAVHSMFQVSHDLILLTIFHITHHAFHVRVVHVVHVMKLVFLLKH